MRTVIVLSMVLILTAFSSVAKADPPSDTEKKANTAADDTTARALHEILRRLDSIEMRLSSMEQQLASMRASSIFSGDIERGMQLDAIERERRLIAPLEKEMWPLNRR